jgi:hypothetical protein
VKTMQNLRTGGLHTKNIIMRFYWSSYTYLCKTIPKYDITHSVLPIPEVYLT